MKTRRRLAHSKRRFDACARAHRLLHDVETAAGTCRALLVVRLRSGRCINGIFPERTRNVNKKLLIRMIAVAIALGGSPALQLASAFAQAGATGGTGTGGTGTPGMATPSTPSTTDVQRPRTPSSATTPRRNPPPTQGMTVPTPETTPGTAVPPPATTPGTAVAPPEVAPMGPETAPSANAAQDQLRRSRRAGTAPPDMRAPGTEPTVIVPAPANGTAAARAHAAASDPTARPSAEQTRRTQRRLRRRATTGGNARPMIAE